MAWADISSDGQFLLIGCSRAENALCSQIPGMNYRQAEGTWRAPLSWPAYVAFRTVWDSQPVKETPALEAYGAKGWAEAQYALGLRGQLDAGETVWPELCDVEHGEQMTGPNGTALYEPQRGGVQWLVAQGRCILADPQGSGKSPQAIRALQVLDRRGKGLPALIIAPGASLLHWRDKLAQWAPELAVRVVAGTAAKRALALQETRERIESCPVHGVMGRRSAQPDRSETHTSASYGSGIPSMQSGSERAAGLASSGTGTGEGPLSGPITSEQPSGSHPSSTMPCSNPRAGTANSARPAGSWSSTMTGVAVPENDHAASASRGSSATSVMSQSREPGKMDGSTGSGCTCREVVLIAWDNVRLHTRVAPWPGQSLVRCTEHGGSNPELKTSRCEVHEKELNAIPFGTIIADEAHRMARPKTKWTRAVWHLAHQAEHFWAMTGTPIGDTVDDLWPVLHAISPRAWPARSRYTDLYAVTRFRFDGGGKEVLQLRPDHADAFHACTQPLIRAIPKQIIRPFWPGRAPAVFRYPPMLPAQKRIYAQLEKEFLADLPDGHVIVPAKQISVFSRLCQAAVASIETRDGEDEHGFTVEEARLCLPSSKVADLSDFLSDEPGQVVVYAWSRQLVSLAARKLDEEKIPHAMITGGMTGEQQYAAARAFQDGKARVIIITSAGAESIDLFAADVILFLQPEPSYLKREQAIGRIDRIGQENVARVVYAITPGTVEERLFRLGEDKQARAGEVMGDASWMRWIVTGERQTVPVA